MNLWKPIAVKADRASARRYQITWTCGCSFMGTTFFALADHLESCPHFRTNGVVHVTTRRREDA